MKAAAAWRAAMATDTGLQRTNNEDRVYMDAERGIFLVVDGLGGHAAGEKAAELATEIIPRELEAVDGPLEDRVRHAISQANNEIYQLSESDAECRGMACVLTLAIAHDDAITVGHVGDSRLYLVWNGAVRKLTSDHSSVGEQEDRGEITEIEAMGHPRRNEVFRDVGSRLHEPADENFIETKSLPFHPEAALLLCSDGLSDVLTSAEISGIVEQYDGDPDNVAQMLVDAANDAGGKDNISVIFVAGTEFLGSASRVMSDARTRHAITRMRRGSKRWRVWLGRLAWLIAGMILGAVALVAIERAIGHPLLLPWLPR
jgi:serine/threonine protein phosphatase PrpC